MTCLVDDVPDLCSDNAYNNWEKTMPRLGIVAIFCLSFAGLQPALAIWEPVPPTEMFGSAYRSGYEHDRRPYGGQDKAKVNGSAKRKAQRTETQHYTPNSSYDDRCWTVRDGRAVPIAC